MGVLAVVIAMTKKDMYGHPITPISEGYGVSVAVNSDGEPVFSVFADDDDYQQALFLVGIHNGSPWLMNTFRDRIKEALAGA